MPKLNLLPQINLERLVVDYHYECAILVDGDFFA